MGGGWPVIRPQVSVDADPFILANSRPDDHTLRKRDAKSEPYPEMLIVTNLIH